MREIVTLLCSTFLIAVCFNSSAQDAMLDYTLDAKEPIAGCKIVAMRSSDDVGKIESIDGSYLNLRIHRDNVYKITINEKKVYYLQYQSLTGFALVDGVAITSPGSQESLAVSSVEAGSSDLGIKYRVQIGAFTKDVSLITFKNLGPVYTEKIDGGVTRYMIGSFTSRDEAAQVETKIRNLGYESAFTVVCYNGKRVSFFEAEEWIVQSIK